MNHLSQDLLRAFVEGELDAPGQEALAAHVAGCDACAHRLAEQARMEEALFEVAAAPAHPLPMARRRRWTAAPLAAAALAAGVALAFALWPSRPARVTDLPDCRASSDPARCLQKAQDDGLVVIGPTSHIVVPHYDLN